jgi:nanoRNase/pAp phosphatase (c-di-AMP/oligoRNAs hydrolase)
MDSQKQQASERIKQANNILVTVSSSPSVDQLSACIGLTVALNKMGKHATAVFSGSIPSTIEFLQPEKTIEKNTDSLRDFIIALDKSKADKLRYKVEDKVVKIFITPYKTSINEKDLEFSQGDFNVDAIVALGVHNQSELDQAITSHGRILHDATIITLNTKAGGELGSINWLDPAASSLSELAVQLIDTLDKKLIDTQIATALLTGIVAETDRFSNSKTSPQTMSISAELMADGANQQLVATKLEEPVAPPPTPAAPIAHQEGGDHPPAEVQEEKKPDDGTLEISHDDKPAEPNDRPDDRPAEPQQEEKHEEQPAPEQQRPVEAQPEPEPAPAPPPPQIHIDEHGSLSALEDMLPPRETTPPSISHHSEGPKMVLEPPTLGGQLTATGTPGPFAGPNDGLGLPNLEEGPLLQPTPPPVITPTVGPALLPPTSPEATSEPDELPSGGAAPSDSFLVSAPKVISPLGSQPANMFADTQSQPATNGLLPGANKTLTDIEKDVHSSHVDALPQTAVPEPTVISPTMPAPQPMQDTGMLPPLSNPGPTPASDPSLSSLGLSDSPVLPQAAPTTSMSQYAQPATVDPQAAAPTLDSARDAVAQAINGSSTQPLEPIQSLNAQPVNLPLGGPTDQGAQQAPNPAQPSWGAGSDPSLNELIGQNPNPNQQNQGQGQSMTPGGQPVYAMPGQVSDPNAPPPVPPPMMPPANPY